MADTPNESDVLVIASIQSEERDGGEIPRVHLRGANWRADDANGPGSGADASRGQADGRTGSTDALNASNGAETAGMSNGEGAGTYLGVRDAKRVVNATDGVGSRTDAFTGPTDVSCVRTDAITPANATQNISTPPRRKKPPDLPSRGTRQAPEEPNGYRNRADTSSVHTDVHSVENDARTAENDSRIVRTRQNEPKTQSSPMETARWTPDAPNGCGSHADGSSARTHAYCAGNGRETPAKEAERVRMLQNGSTTQNSPETHETATPKPTNRWRKVSVGNGDVYVPWNAPIETASRNFVFGRVQSGDEAIAPIVEGERAGDGDGGGYEDDGDVGDTTSGGDLDSKRVEAALLAIDSQLERQSRRIQNNDLPVSSWPPVQPESRPYGPIRRRRRRGRLKIERINVSQTPERETTYLERPHATQPPGNSSNHAYGIVRPRRRRGRIKIEPTNVSRTRNGGNAYLGRVNAIRSMQRPKRQIKRVNKLSSDSRMPGEPWRDDEDHG